MLEYDFDGSLGYWVCATSHALRRALDGELARERITMRQWEVLAVIALEGELAQGDLAERLGIEAPTLAGIVARMERDGWLERTCCSKDRRRKRIRATAQAEAVWNRMVECCERVRARAVEGISAEELAFFRDICMRIRTNLGQTKAVAACAGGPSATEQPAATASARHAGSPSPQPHPEGVQHR